jgi:hypothetical protein
MEKEISKVVDSPEASDSEFEELVEKPISKFNIVDYEKRNFEQAEFLRAQLKGRRGIGNYDTFCECFGDTDYKVCSKMDYKKNVKPNGKLISPGNKSLYFQIGAD